MNTLTRRSNLARSFLLASLLAAANAPAQANPVTTLQLVIGGISLTADLLGIGGTFVDIFGAPNLGTQSDDSPLYTSGSSSPSLTISATDTTFDLLLKQTNNISEFEDDLPAVLSGITKVSSKNGQTDAWSWKVTLEANINTFSFSEVSAQGFVQHLFVVHPDLDESSQAPALNYDLLAKQNSVLSAHNLSDSDTDTQTHANGPHQDVLKPATLETRWVTSDEFDYVNVRLHAVHAVPEPQAMLLLAAGGLVAWLARRRTTIS
ncbi:PEP-CTERM sorting domain-containing protein [Aquabacterium sp. CECT 9606]|uniref:PEP-CTERM sorting domain-containing protein n=1 Tax=Aquabacterium sp. CECT 9606 TaxID=2845822 RepID=UPI001E545496|nr:PEP-CTERM sorting domain-containing protein [Aquabacterium sp. CECT 9606]CAH0350942.1 hypothetical protein AQB9606_01845 [Aquabacterium sp. CECT 9606]